MDLSSDPQPQGQPNRPGHTIWSSRPSPYPRPIPSEIMAGYRRYQLSHLAHEFTKFLDQLCSPELPEHPLLLPHIVRKLLADFTDHGTQTDGCPHAEPCCPEPGPPVSPPRPSSPHLHPPFLSCFGFYLL